MSKVALLVVDVQRAFQEIPVLKPSLEMAINFAIKPALELFRETKNPIFFIQHIGALTPEGSPGFELSTSFQRQEKEYQITKKFPNSFFQTDLKEKLAREDVGFVVICGMAAGYCVNATVQGATEAGLKTAILQHSIASHKESHIQVAYETNPVISLEALKFFL